MTTAFQSNAFQNNAFQIDATPPVVTVPIVGGGWVRHRAGDERGVINQFTRKRWDELKAAWQAQEALAKQAQDEKKPSRRKALRKAAQVAAEALEIAGREAEQAALNARLVTIRLAMESAVSAERVAQRLENAKMVQELALAIMSEIDEEEAAMLLLS